MQSSSAPKPESPARRLPPFVASVLQHTAERALGLDRIWRIHDQLSAFSDPAQFAAQALDLLGVRFELDPRQLAHVPAAGPAVVVANHPFGGLEGLFLIATLLTRRPDVKVLANHWLSRIPELRPVFVPVNPFGGPDAARFNVAGLRQAFRHLRDGGVLILFPAGEVSHLQWASRRIVDPRWHPTAARIVRHANCTVVPVHFGGSNSAVFQLAGLVHPGLRTALLPRELLNKRRRRVPVTIGAAIPARRIAAQKDDDALASLLRISTYGLSAETVLRRRRTPRLAAVMETLPAAKIAAEIDALPATNTLLRSGELRIVFAHAGQLPHALKEVGRLRELTFRSVGEGTGRALDLDAYDEYYVQLLAWNEARREIVGGYRIGHVDDITARFGCSGLYTHSLFAFGKALLAHLGPALELGRSFVAPEYQRSYAPLLALWRGIAEYVSRHPRYRVLFGPVSISNDYRGASRELLVQYLRRQCYASELARLIRPRRAPARRHPLAALGEDVARLPALEDIGAVITGMEPDGKGVPVLLRQYLKLGGRLIGFNVDARFSDAIDGLIVVDLPTLEPRTLERYMGKQEAAAYLAFHAGTAPARRKAG